MISLITRAEVLSGPMLGDPALIAEWLDQFPILPMERNTADLAAELRRKHKWRLLDAFQVALAQIHGLRIATRNIRDLPPDRYSFVLVPYTIK